MSTALLIVILAIGALFDIKYREVPNKIIITGIAAAFLLSIITKNYSNILSAVIVFGVLYLLYIVKDNILPGGDIKGLVFIVMTKGINYFALAVYYILLTAIPVVLYIIVKNKIKKANDVPPLYVPMLLGCLLLLGGVV